MKSKIVTFASQHIAEFNSVYNKTQFSMHVLLPTMIADFFGSDILLVSSAAVFWDVMQRSPQRNSCSQLNHIPFHCVCGLVVVC